MEGELSEVSQLVSFPLSRHEVSVLIAVRFLRRTLFVRRSVGRCSSSLVSRTRLSTAKATH